MNKQQNSDSATTVQEENMLELYTISTHNIHYILHNLFRGLKPIRRKYKLSVNEIIFLNGIYLYCRHVSTCISQDACLKFVSYYNLHKVKYYISSLLAKNMIQLAEVIKGYNRYRITPLGMSAIDEISGNFNECLYSWYDKYNIVL